MVGPTVAATTTHEIMNNDALMASWAKTRIVIAVRVDARSDAKIRLDSDMVREVTGWPR